MSARTADKKMPSEQPQRRFSVGWIVPRHNYSHERADSRPNGKPLLGHFSFAPPTSGQCLRGPLRIDEKDRSASLRCGSLRMGNPNPRSSTILRCSQSRIAKSLRGLRESSWYSLGTIQLPLHRARPKSRHRAERIHRFSRPNTVPQNTDRETGPKLAPHCQRSP